MSAIRGELLTFPQAKGPDVTLRVSGDEFYARYETADGYTVVYDTSKGLYCYAKIVAGEFVSTGISISDPAPNGSRRHLRENHEIRASKFALRKNLQSPPRRAVSAPLNERTLGIDKGLLPGPKIFEGQVRGITILIDFKDEKNTIPVEEISAMLNKEGYGGGGNYCSVRDYFRSMSGGKLDYTNDVYGPITLEQDKTYYITGPNRPPLRKILAELRKQGVNFAEYDNDNDGYVDAITLLYAGKTVYAGWLWPHNSAIEISLGDVSSLLYTVVSNGSASIGTFCHEAGHMLCRFPDLYDYGERDGDFDDSTGLGAYCLMSTGNHLDRGKTPSAICAYLRDLAGWTNTVSLNQPGVFVASWGDFKTVLRYSLDDAEYEYFLVENRLAHGIDEHLPASGLAVYHCDINGSNEYEEGLPGRHYQCALLQADGRMDLEKNVNEGDPLDLFKAAQGIALSYDTNPSTKRWDRSDSGFVLAEISAPGERITFEVKDGR